MRTALAVVVLCCGSVFAQETSPRPPEKPKIPPPAPKDPLPVLKASPQVKKFPARDPADVKITPELLKSAVEASVPKLLAMQEGVEKSEWPYEGVYRVGGQIPVGYRFGGTAITAWALTRIPGYDTDKERQDSVARAVKFVCSGIDHPLMSEKDYDAGYDVRGWAYTYGLMIMADLKHRELIPKGQEEACEKAAKWYLDAINKTAIPECGGWNYARQPGRNKTGAPSPFMTGPTLQALFAAKRAGYEVDEKVINDALVTLERARNEKTKEIIYSGFAKEGGKDGVPGAMGRMCAAEATLVLAGRGKIENVRNAVDAFIEHWKQLDIRRQEPGTHVGVYGVAPYYFYYAHYYAAQAVELLPEAERAERREKINALLFRVRQADDTWNDRVFKRSANFGTSMACMAILSPTLGAPADFRKAEQAKASKSSD